MLSNLRPLLVFTVLCTPSASLCLRTYENEFNLLGNGVLTGTRKSELSGTFLSDRRRFLYQPVNYPPSPVKRMSAYNYKYLNQARGKVYQNGEKSDRHAKYTLSLDVPTNVMNILFDFAKAKKLRTKAAQNARLMAQIGRRK